MLSAKRIHWLKLGFLLFILLGGMAIRVGAQPVPEKKRVMVLHRQGDASDWEMLFNNGFFAHLNNDPAHQVNVSFEFLALENNVDAEPPDDILAYLRAKTAVNPVDLVVAVLPSANTFLLEYGDEIFPGVPRLFVIPGGQNMEAAQAVPESAVVESASTQALYSTVEDIFAILPDTQNLVVVSGSGETDDAYLVRAEAAITDLVDSSIQVNYLIGVPLDDLLVQVSQLPDNTAILFLIYENDLNGGEYTITDVIPFLSERANAPVFSFVDATFGKGIVGGNLTSARLYGETAAEVGKQLLADPMATGLSVTEGRTADFYDWRQLRRWNIPEDRLPPMSLVEHKTETFWEMYRFGILAILIVIALQTLLIVTLVRVLHQRRQAELARQQSEQLYRLLAQNVADVVWILKADGLEFNYISPSVERLLGFTADEVMANSIVHITAPDSLVFIETELPARLHQFLKGDQNAVTRRDEIAQLHKDGTTVWTEISSTIVRNEQGDLEIVGVSRDISQSRQAAADLRESEEKYRTLIEHANDGLIIVQDGLVKFANTRLADLLGYTVDEVLNTDSTNYVFPDQRTRIEDISRRRTKGSETVPNIYETVLYRKDGQGLEVEVNAGLTTYEGKPASMAFIRDITERKYLEAASRNAEILRVQLEKEKEMSNLKARFVTTVSHEFRTPLAVIQTSAGLLSHYYMQLTDERRQQLFQQIDQQVADMTDLMDNTLTISQSQDGEVVFNPVEMDVEAFCRGIFEKIQLIDKQTHRFELNSYVSKPLVKLDSNLLRHILTNLLSNAVKYTPQNGKITLVVDQTADKIMLEVRDEGIGIPEADMPRLFDSFHRASNVGNISGTGLGLAIVRQYVVLHGGQIEAESVIGQGSTFRVILPTNGD